MLRGTIRRRPLLVEEVDEFGGFIVVVLLVTGVKQSQLLYLRDEIQKKTVKRVTSSKKEGGG